jgi:hypothetical protein
MVHSFVLLQNGQPIYQSFKNQQNKTKQKTDKTHDPLLNKARAGEGIIDEWGWVDDDVFAPLMIKGHNGVNRKRPIVDRWIDHSIQRIPKGYL